MRVTLTLTLLFLTTALAVKLKGSPSAPSAVSRVTAGYAASQREEAEQRYRDESDGCLESRLERAKKREGQDRGFRAKFHNPTNSETETLLKSEVARRDNIHTDLKAAKELYQHETDEWVAYTLQKAEGRRARNKERQFDNTSVDTDLNLLRAETARRDKIKKDQASFGEPIAPANRHEGFELGENPIVKALYQCRSDYEIDLMANNIRKQVDDLQNQPNSKRREALKRQRDELTNELDQRLQDRIDTASKALTRDHDCGRPNQQQQPYQPFYQSPYQPIPPQSGGAGDTNGSTGRFEYPSHTMMAGRYHEQYSTQDQARDQYHQGRSHSTLAINAPVYHQQYPGSTQQTHQQHNAGYDFNSDTPGTSYDQSRDSGWRYQTDHRQG